MCANNSKKFSFFAKDWIAVNKNHFVFSSLLEKCRHCAETTVINTNNVVIRPVLQSKVYSLQCELLSFLSI